MAIPFVTTLDDSQFQAGLKNMEKGGKRVEGSLVGSFNSMAKGIGASMAAAFTVGAVVNAAKSVIDFAGQLQDQAEALGINTEVLQGFQGAMANSGVSAEKFTKGMATLISSIQQAKEDTGTARDSFAALGIEFDSIANDSPDEILLKIADGLKNAKDPAAAYAAALDLVGKNQINFVAALKEGREEFSQTASTIKTASAEQVAAIARLGDAWDKATTAAKTYGIEVLDILTDPAGALQRQDEVEHIQNVEDMRKVAAGDTKKLDAMKKHEELVKGGVNKNYRDIVAQQELLESMGVNMLSTNYKNDFDNLKKAEEHAARQKAKPKPEYLGPEYTPPASTVEDPRVKKAREAEEKSVKELRDFEAEQYRQFTSGKQSEAEKFAEEEKKRIKELSDFEAEQYRQFTSGKQQADAKAAEDQKKQAAQDAARANLEKAGQDLQQAKQNTANAEKETTDARSSLQRALEGNPDARETGQQRQVKRTMKQLEKQLDEPARDPNKGTSLDDETKSTSSRRGTKKALEELKTAKDEEKAAKKAEDLIKEQQKKMVKALEDIDRGINGN
jgi:hypothetical protein